MYGSYYSSYGSYRDRPRVRSSRRARVMAACGRRHSSCRRRRRRRRSSSSGGTSSGLALRRLLASLLLQPLMVLQIDNRADTATFTAAAA